MEAMRRWTKLTVTVTATTVALVAWTVVRTVLALTGVMPPIGGAPVDVVEFVVLSGLFVLFAIISRRSGENGRAVAAILASLFWLGYAVFVAVSL